MCSPLLTSGCCSSWLLLLLLLLGLRLLLLLLLLHSTALCCCLRGSGYGWHLGGCSCCRLLLLLRRLGLLLHCWLCLLLCWLCLLLCRLCLLYCGLRLLLHLLLHRLCLLLCWLRLLLCRLCLLRHLLLLLHGLRLLLRRLTCRNSSCSSWWRLCSRCHTLLATCPYAMHGFLIGVVLCCACAYVWVRVVYWIRVHTHKPLLTHTQPRHNQAVVEHLTLQVEGTQISMLVRHCVTGRRSRIVTV
jgi:hypothetical protein